MDPVSTSSSGIITDEKNNRLKYWLQALGPGVITAALVFGPSKMTISSKLGAEYGYNLLWIIVIAIFFMAVFTSMAARIGMATDQSLLSVIRGKWGNVAAIAIGFGVFMATASFQAGNSIGVGISMAELTGTSTTPWVIIFNLIAIFLLFFKAFYKVLQRIMLLLIMMMLLAFIITFFISGPSVKSIVNGFIPVVPDGSLPLITAFIASSFSIVAAFYQSYLMQERKKLLRPGQALKDRSLTGILILGLMTAIVLICAAVVLHPQGVKLMTASDMAKALEPLFGHYASVLFLCGLFGAAFSSLIGNAALGGTVFGDALGLGGQLHSTKVRVLIAMIMLTGAVVAIAFGKLPLELIVFAQTVTIFVVPFIGMTMFMIANDSAVMGSLVNTPVVKIAGAIGLLLIIVLALESGRNLFFK